jgi:glycogen operon protein
MILGGDEIARTQKGNNNAYCQDNDISWYDWSLVEKNSDHFRFVREMVAFRLRHPGFMRPEFYTGRDGDYDAIPDISWFDEQGDLPVWDKTDGCLAMRIDGSKAEILADRDDNDFFIMFNSTEKPVPFTVCEAPEGEVWARAVDTGLPSPEDICAPGKEKSLPNQQTYLVQDRSMVILISKVLG